MRVIGIVGGMGSGKSTVVGLIQELRNVYTISADHIGHDILKKGKQGYSQVLESFGSRVLGQDGEINRSALGKIVFSNKLELKKLNQISHPLIYKKVKEEISHALKKETYDYIIVDAALLIEIGLVPLVDQVWGVYLPEDIQVKRIMLRNGLSKEEAKKRMTSQLPWDEIKKIVDVQINNTDTISRTREQISYILEQN